MKVLVSVPLSPYSGYGNDGLGIVRALLRWGADVYLQPSAVQAPLPVDVAALLTKEVRGPFDLAIVHLDPARLEATDNMKAHASVVIGWTMWEWTNLKNLRGHSKLRKAWKNFDAIVAYDDVSQTAIKEYYAGPVPVVQGGFWPEDWPEMERDFFETNFYYCMVGNLTERKDPFVAIQAFKELKEEFPEEFEPARLSLKTMVPGLHSAMEQTWPWLRIYYDIWDDTTLRNFYASQHVLLAPSQGEGKNMPALEFQSSGGTVIATNWGGHRQWLNPSYNYPLKYEMKPYAPGHPETQNAKASVEDMKALILHTFRNRGEVKDKGKLAAQIIPPMSSWDAVLERFLLRVSEEIPKDKGQALWIKASMARQEHDAQD